MEAKNIETYLNHKGRGFINIWAVNPKTGEKVLLVDKPNLILYSGADILAQALAGTTNSNISNIYVGYNTVAGDVEWAPPTIDRAYSIPFSNYGTIAYPTFGYLRLPLSYTPSFIAPNANYQSNIVVFTTVIAASPTPQHNSYAFNDTSQIFEVALVSAFNTSNDTQDKVFSRANFSAITYNPAFNLTIAWGVQFLA